MDKQLQDFIYLILKTRIMIKQLKELPIPESKLEKCFYCSQLLPAKQKEHIFNSSWGGSHKTGNLICDDCNQSFSTKIDLSFKVYTDIIMNARSFKGERHKEIPKIYFLEDKDYLIDAGGKLKLKRTIIEDERLADGTIKSHIIFPSKTKAKQWVNDGGMAELLGREPSPEEKDYVLELIKNTQPISTHAEPQKATVELNLSEQYRSAAHTILKCLGFFLPNLVVDCSTKAVREFARYDRGDWRDFAVDVEQLLSIGEELTRDIGVYHNSVEVYWCSSLKKVIGVLKIMNRVKISVIIADNNSGLNAILYIGENTDGSKQPPKALYMEFEPNQVPDFCRVKYFKDLDWSEIYQIIGNEMDFLSQIDSPIAALTNEFGKELEDFINKNEIIDLDNLDSCRNLFVRYFLRFDKLMGVQVDEHKLRSQLEKYGFSTLADRYQGKLYKDSDVQSIIVSACEKVTNDLLLSDFNAN